MSSDLVPHNIPRPEFTNLFSSDPLGRELFESWLGSESFSDVRDHFETMGKAGAEATPLSDRADKRGPIIRKYDERGERIDEIQYDPSYLRLRELSYGQKIVSYKYEEAFLNKHRKNRHLVGFGAAYYFAQTEMGLFCPICMTDALARVLELHGKNPEAKLALKHLTTNKLSELWEGAMFLTERQGGSDVGANLVSAYQEDGQWKLRGHKWFCSNVDAKAILALARMPGNEGSLDKGTRGLGLFLVMRDKPTENFKSWEVHRLKEKLGVRAMASGEVTFDGTTAYLIGGAGEGFKQMADMVNMSRLYNSVSSIAIVKRAVIEAIRYADKRLAFGAKVSQLPLWKATMADLIAEQIGAFVMVFDCIRALDLADQGDQESASFFRIMTPVCKATTGKLSVFACSEAMEAIGGNAYIEEHILPRLLRDAQVLPIWEGTTNIQCLDMLRALSKEGSEPLKGRLANALVRAEQNKVHSSRLEKLKSLIDRWKADLVKISQLSKEDQQRRARYLLDRTSRVVTMALLLESAAGDRRELFEHCFDRLAVRKSSTSALASADEVCENRTEDLLIQSV